MSVAISTGAPHTVGYSDTLVFHSIMPPQKPRKTLIQAIKKMKGKAVMQPGDTPTGDDERQVEVQPVVEGVGQVITIVERGGHPRGRGRGAGSRGRGRGRGRGDEDIVAQAMEETDVGGTSSEDDTEFPAQKKKKTAEVVLTPEQEQAVCDWLQEFPQVWNTRHESYRKTPEKDLLWEEQGQKMGLTGSHLKQWYMSTRSNFSPGSSGRLNLVSFFWRRGVSRLSRNWNMSGGMRR